MNQKRISKPVCIALGVLELALVFGWVFYKFTHGLEHMQSDNASNLVYAKLLSQGNLFVSKDWYFPTEFNFADGIPIYALLFKLFPGMSWAGVEALGNGVVLGLAGLAALWLGWLLELGTAAFVLPLFVLVPTFSDYIYYAAMQGSDFYMFGVFRTFWLFSLLVLCLKTQKRGVRLAALAGFAANCAVISLSGLRFVEVYTLPLFLAAVLLTVLCSGLFRAEKDKLSLPELARDAWRQNCGLQLTCMAGLALVISGVGYLINDRVLSKIFRFDTYNNLTWKDFTLEPVEETLNQFLWAFGFTSKGEVSSLGGVANLCAFVLLAMTLYSCYKLLRHWQDYTLGQRLMPVFWLCACFCYLFINTFVYDKWTLRYLIHFFPVFGVVPVCFLVGDKTTSRLFKRLFAGVLAVVMLAVSVGAFDYYKKDVHVKDIPIENMQTAAAWLQEQGCTFGYASFWDANVVTYLTNGAVDMCALNKFEFWYPSEWLNSRQNVHRESDEPVFLLLSGQEYAECAQAGYAYTAEQYVAETTDTYVILRYDSTTALSDLFNPWPTD